MPASSPLGVQPRATALAAAARMLAAQGVAGIDAVLADAAAAIGCAGIALRRTGHGEAFAAVTAARIAVPQQPTAERWVLDAPARAFGQVLGILTATAVTPFEPAQAELLTAYADLLALALAAEPESGPDGSTGVARLVLDEEAERARLAAELQETVGQALVAVRYAAERVAAGVDPAAVLDEPVRAALETFRLAHGDLRAHALDAGLRVALTALAARGGGDRPADGEPARRVTVAAADPALDGVPPAVAITVQRVAEAALRGSRGDVWVSASRNPDGVKLTVECADIACDASELDRWARRALALGGDLQARPDGVELRLPVPPPIREGHDDDRPDL